MEFFGSNGYIVYAVFDNTGGIKVGSVVEISGVEVGRVKSVSLEDYRAKVAIMLEKDIQLQDDSIASIKSKGLIGENYIAITPGGSDKIIKSKNTIRETESFVSIFDLIKKYALGSIKSEGEE
jgi:phospholipid/cholesterol/gamma-HCH transport system substrate-binding protein